MALRHSETKYREIVENANEAIVVAQGGKSKFFNGRALEITGFSNEEFASKPLLEIVHPDDQEMILERNLRRLRGEDVPSIYSFRIIDRNGHVKWAEINAVRIEWEGKPATLNFLTDISARKLAEDRLRDSEERFRIIYQESPIGIQLYDQEGKLLHINKACMRIFRVQDVKEVTGRRLFQDPNLTAEAKEALLRGETVRYEADFDFENVEEKNDHTIKKPERLHVEVSITPLGFEDEKRVGYLVYVQDVSDRKRAEEHIHLLSQQLIRAQENERQMISRELHDRVAQELSSAKIGLDMLFDDHPEVAHEMKQRVANLSKRLQVSIAAVRDLSYDLRPPSLDQLGIAETIFQYCADFSEKTEINVDFTAVGLDGRRLDPDREINLYRLIQEGLNNIRKHANASRVILRLVAVHPNIILRIEDDGRGFDVKKRMASITGEKRMGLRSMEERVNLLEGIMRIRSRPGKGTKIFIEIPFEEKDIDPEEKHTGGG